MNRIPGTTLTVLCVALLAGLSATASAESKDFGKFQVHYSIFTSTFLQPDIAKQYNLTRSRSIGVINVSVMQKDADGHVKPVTSQIEGQVSNDIQQTQFLAFRQITEGDAIYYVAQFPYRSAELQTFGITLNPTGSQTELPIRTTQILFND